MLNFTGSTAVQNDAVLDQFDDELEESGSLPFVQLVADIGKQAAKAARNPLSYGICINADNAEIVGFQPSDNWAEGEDITIHPQTPATIDKGWVARTVNMIVLHYSDLEVQEKRVSGDNTYWAFIGTQYQGRVKTEAGKLYEQHKDSTDRPYRIVRRLLCLFVDDQMKLIHDAPLQLTTKGAFGASLSGEYQEFISELSKAYCQASKAAGSNVKSNKRFSRSAQSYVLFPVVFGPHIPKEADRSSYVCVAERYQPVFGADKAGQTHDVEANGRKVKLHTADYSNFIIPKGSELGRIVGELCAEYESFPLPNRGVEISDTPASPTGEQPYSGEGMLDMSTLDIQDNGTYVTLMTDEGAVPLRIGPEHPDALDHMNLKIQGVIPADGGPVQVTAWEAVDVMGDTPEPAQQPLIPSFG